jgi:Sperm-tail PG-rich repeat
MLKVSPTWTMASRKFYIHQEITPGPGAYSITSKNSGPVYRLGKSGRSTLGSNELNPGPGAYNPNKPLVFQGNT